MPKTIDYICSELKFMKRKVRVTNLKQYLFNCFVVTVLSCLTVHTIASDLGKKQNIIEKVEEKVKE